MQIEELIQQFNPTMVIVEHDKAFQQTVATKLYLCSSKRILENIIINLSP